MSKLLDIVCRLGVVLIWGSALVVLIVWSMWGSTNVGVISLSNAVAFAVIVGTAIIINLLWLWVLGYGYWAEEYGPVEWQGFFVIVGLMGIIAGFIASLFNLFYGWLFPFLTPFIDEIKSLLS